MKGPGMRIELDVSRVWRCPECGRTVGTRGTVTARRCRCTGAGQWMLLDEPIRRPRSFAGVIDGIKQQRKPDEQNKPAAKATETAADSPAEDNAEGPSDTESPTDSPEGRHTGETAAEATATPDSSASAAAPRATGSEEKESPGEQADSGQLAE